MIDPQAVSQMCLPSIGYLCQVFVHKKHSQQAKINDILVLCTKNNKYKMYFNNKKGH